MTRSKLLHHLSCILALMLVVDSHLLASDDLPEGAVFAIDANQRTPSGNNYFCAFALSADGKTLVAQLSDRVWVFDVPHQKRKLEVNVKAPRRRPRADSGTRNIIIDSRTGVALVRLQIGVYSLALDGSSLKTLSASTKDEFHAIGTDAHGARFLLNEYGVWNCKNATPLSQCLVLSEAIDSYSMSANGEYVAQLDQSKLLIYGRNNPEPRIFNEFGEWSNLKVANVSSKGHAVLTCSTFHGARKAIIVCDGLTSTTFDSNGECLAISDDGQLMAYAVSNAEIALIDLPSRQCILRWQVTEDFNHCKAISNNGRYLTATSGSNCNALIWDLDVISAKHSKLKTDSDNVDLWNALGLPSSESFRARRLLIANGDKSLGTIRKYVDDSTNAQFIGSIVDRLNDEQYTERELASRQLAQYWPLAMPQLNKIASETKVPEIKSRLLRLSLSQEARLSAHRIQRCLQLLDCIATNDALDLRNRIIALTASASP